MKKNRFISFFSAILTFLGISNPIQAQDIKRNQDSLKTMPANSELSDNKQKHVSKKNTEFWSKNKKTIAKITGISTLALVSGLLIVPKVNAAPPMHWGTPLNIDKKAMEDYFTRTDHPKDEFENPLIHYVQPSGKLDDREIHVFNYPAMVSDGENGLYAQLTKFLQELGAMFKSYVTDRGYTFDDWKTGKAFGFMTLPLRTMLNNRIVATMEVLNFSTRATLLSSDNEHLIKSNKVFVVVLDKRKVTLFEETFRNYHHFAGGDVFYGDYGQTQPLFNELQNTPEMRPEYMAKIPVLHEKICALMNGSKFRNTDSNIPSHSFGVPELTSTTENSTVITDVTDDTDNDSKTGDTTSNPKIEEPEN